MNDLAKSDYIATELKKFNLTDAAIAEMSQNYLPLVINGVDDKAGFTSVYEARQTVKNKRIDVEKRRKELTSDAVKFQKAINTEAKRITDLLDPIETHLEQQERAYQAEKDRIKQEKERLEQEKLQGRINKLLSIGFIFNGIKYVSDIKICELPGGRDDQNLVDFDPVYLKVMADEVFDRSYNAIKVVFDDRQRKLAEIEAQRREEAARIEEQRRKEAEALEQQRKELEAQRQQLEVIAKAQAQKEKELAEEKSKIEDTKKRNFHEGNISEKPEPIKPEVSEIELIKNIDSYEAVKILNSLYSKHPGKKPNAMIRLNCVTFMFSQDQK